MDAAVSNGNWFWTPNAARPGGSAFGFRRLGDPLVVVHQIMEGAQQEEAQIVLGVAGIPLPMVGMIHGYAIWVGGSVLGGFALAAVALVLLHVGGSYG
jgi:hypothetical protein